MVGSNEIRGDDDPLFEPILYYLVIITSFHRHHHHFSRYRRWLVVAITVVVAPMHRRGNAFIRIRSQYTSIVFGLCASPFSHVISLLTRIYFLYRSVLQFAICASFTATSHIYTDTYAFTCQ